MKLLLFLFFPILSFTSGYNLTISSEPENDLFIEICELSSTLILNCYKSSIERNKKSVNPNELIEKIQICLQKKSLLALDRIAAQDVIELPYGITLELNKKENETITREVRTYSEMNITKEAWASLVIQRIKSLLNTHILKMQMERNPSISEGRRRQHGHMMPLMLFGMMAMAIIAIPMGFQFLAVLGGKALLLAKLALILTSIQGLKKIATSGINYGFYHSPSHSRPWLYDRRWQPFGIDHHSYEGLDIPDQQLDNGFQHIRPRVSQEQM